METRPSLPNRETTRKVISLFRETCEKIDLNDPPDLENPDNISGAAQRVQPTIDRFNDDVCSLVVIGEIKKGKTSLINSLLELGDLLPVSDNVTTSTVYKLVYGPKRRNIAVLRHSNVTFPNLDNLDISTDDIDSAFKEHVEKGYTLVEKEIADDRLVAYGTEDGNPGNEKNVDHIRIEIPSPVLEQGLSIIDTPGLGGLIREHAEITWQYIPRAHAVLFVLESIQSPLTNEEQQFLEQLKKISPLIFFVQTKIDVSARPQWESWRKRNLEEVAKVLGMTEDDIPYFAVSSKRKVRFLEENDPQSYERSGFQPVENYIFDRLMAAFHRQMCFGVVESVNAEAASALARVREALNVAKTDTEEMISELESEYSRKRKEFARFESEEFPDMVTAFQDDLARLIEEGDQELGDFLQPSSYNPAVAEFIDGVKNISASPRKIKSKIDELCSYFADYCGNEATRIYEDCKRQVDELVLDSFTRIADRIEELGISAPGDTAPDDHGQEESFASRALILHERQDDVLPAIRFKDNTLRFSRFDEAKNAFFGGSVGGAMGYAGGLALATATSAIFPPAAPFAPVIASVSGSLGTVLGALVSSRNTTQNMRDKTIAHFEQALPGILMQMQKQFSRKFRYEMKALQRRVRDERTRILRTMRKDIADRLADIESCRTSTGQEGARKIKRLSSEKAQLGKLVFACGQAVGMRPKPQGGDQ